MKDPIKFKIDTQDRLINRFEQFNKEYAPILLDKIFEYIDKFARSKGFLVLEKNSGFLLGEFAKKLVDDFKNSTYISDIGSLLGNFDELETANKLLLSVINDNFDFDALDFSKEKKLIINELTESLLRPESFRVNIANDVRKILARNILTGAPIKDLKDELKRSVISSETGGGILGRYTTQITTDAVSQYSGIINDKLAKEVDLNAIGYLGSIIANSRVQCVRWKDQKGAVLLRKEKVAKLGYLPDEVKWANANGQGYGKKGSTSYILLTEANFMQYRGGYGCRHDAIPFHFDDKYYTRYKKLKDQYDKETLKNIESQKK